MNKKDVTLSVETITNVLNYLSERPYREVEGLIKTIIEEANRPKEDEKPTEAKVITD